MSTSTITISNLEKLQAAPGGINRITERERVVTEKAELKAARLAVKEAENKIKAEKKAAKEAKKAMVENLKAEKKAAKEAKQAAKDAKKPTEKKDPKITASTAWVFFLKAETARMNKEVDQINSHDRLKVISENWKALGVEGQAPFIKQHEDDKQRIAGLSEEEVLAEYNASAAGQRAIKKAATAAKKAAKETVAPAAVTEVPAVVIEEPATVTTAVDFGSTDKETVNEKNTTPQNSPGGLPADGVGAAIISAATASSNAIAATTNATAVANLTQIDEEIFNAEPDSSSTLGTFVIEAAHAAKAFAAASVAAQSELCEMKKHIAGLEGNFKSELVRKGNIIRKLQEENQALKEAAKAAVITEQLNEILPVTKQSPTKEPEVEQSPVKEVCIKQSAAVEELTTEITPKTFEVDGGDESSPLFTVNEVEEKKREFEGYTYTESSGVIYTTDGESVGYTGEDNDEIEWVSGWNTTTHQMEE